MLLSEIRQDFSLSWATIDAFERGARVLDTMPAEQAAREVALAEDDLAFHGGSGSTGFLGGSDGPRVNLGDWSSAGQVAADLLSAVSQLDAAGIAGPYATVLDPSATTRTSASPPSAALDRGGPARGTLPRHLSHLGRPQRRRSSRSAAATSSSSSAAT
jgi:uncharacterized linocin/CFP29 family protein